MELSGKKVIAIGERDGVQGTSIGNCARSAGATRVAQFQSVRFGHIRALLDAHRESGSEAEDYREADAADYDESTAADHARAPYAPIVKTTPRASPGDSISLSQASEASSMWTVSVMSDPTSSLPSAMNRSVSSRFRRVGHGTKTGG